MTVCIAVVCENGKRIVAVSDTKVTFGGLHSADEIAQKNTPVAANWSALHSGELVDAPAIIEDVTSRLASLPAPTTTEATAALQAACLARHRERIDAEVLSRYGLTLASFLETGKAHLTEHIFDRLCDEIADVKDGSDFLLIGFEGPEEPRLVWINGDKAPSRYDQIGFCAIGSGGYAAQTALAFHADRGNMGFHLDWASAVYCACDAKFRSEYASDVGRQTFLAVFEYDREPQLISPLRIEREIRSVWERQGAHRVPESIRKLLPDLTYLPSQLGTEEGWRRFLGRTSNLSKIDRQRQITREYQALRRSLKFKKAAEKPAAENT